jgi:metal-responsive CopG/Arc/MetJ family transcriptional regulator
MAKSRTSRVYTISLPPELAQNAEALAERDSRSMSELFREAFRTYYSQQAGRGDFQTAAVHSLEPSEAQTMSQPESRVKDIVELFAPLRGLNLDFDRNPSTGRSVEL